MASSDSTQLLESGTLSTDVDQPVHGARSRWSVAIAATVTVLGVAAVLQLAAHGMSISSKMESFETKAQVPDCLLPGEDGDGRTCSKNEVAKLRELMIGNPFWLDKALKKKGTSVPEQLAWCNLARAAGLLPEEAPTGFAKPRNMIHMLSDGMGPVMVTFARQYSNYKDGLWTNDANFNGVCDAGKTCAISKHLPIDDLLVGTVQTRSANSHITDSAAGITAYSCGERTNNHWIAKLPRDDTISYPWAEDDGIPCETILEKAKAAGFVTGLVVTSRFTHATPAGYASHTVDRDDENYIAKQIIETSQPNVIFGGGARHLLPQGTSGSKRKDDWDGFAAAETAGYTVLRDYADLQAFIAKGTGSGNNWAPETKCPKVLFMCANSHCKYEIDRANDPTSQPSLEQMMQIALLVLRSCDEPHFMLMESSRIDHALHSNDVGTALRDTLMYQQTLENVILPVSSKDTLIIGTSDHNTGGVTLGASAISPYPHIPIVDYAWYPEVLAGQSGSTEEGCLTGYPPKDANDVATVQQEWRTKVEQCFTLPSVVLGQHDLRESQFSPTKWEDQDFEEMNQAIEDYVALQCADPNSARCVYGIDEELMLATNTYSDSTAPKIAVSRTIAQKAGIAVTTRGHEATDINLYCSAPGGPQHCFDLGFTGNMDNSAVGQKMAKAIGLDPTVQRFDM